MEVRNIGLLGLACLLAACGGGGGGSGVQSGGQTPVQLPSGPKTYTAASATVGDYYSYKEQSKIDGQEDGTDYITNLVSNVTKDGAKTAKAFGDYASIEEPQTFSSISSTDEYDSTGHWVSNSDGYCTTTNKLPFFYVAPYTISAGMSWQHTGTYERQCGTGQIKQSTLDHKNTVGAIEAVTVPAGTFNALKVTRNSTTDSGTTSTVSERTCWWEPDLGVEVRCVDKIVRTTKATGATKNLEYVDELIGFSNQKLARKFDTVLRFVGTWTGSFSGATSGTCSLSFDSNGTIKGNCNGASVSFDIAGKIEADGKLAFNLTANGTTGQTFTGKVDTLQQMSGVWSVPNFGSGTWVITQD